MNLTTSFIIAIIVLVVVVVVTYFVMTLYINSLNQQALQATFPMTG